MPKTVIQKLRKIDLSIAQKVNRRKIGSLVGRLYFTPLGSTATKEVPITSFVDLGASGQSSEVGISSQAHQYQVQVDRDWYDKNRGLQGNYSIIVSGNPRETPLQVEIASEVADDNKTFALMTFTVDLQISPF